MHGFVRGDPPKFYKLQTSPYPQTKTWICLGINSHHLFIHTEVGDQDTEMKRKSGGEVAEARSGNQKGVNFGCVPNECTMLNT